METKKKLILVGNKQPYRDDLSNIIDSFDYVLRISRMNNLGITGNKIDAIYLEANEPFKYIFKGGDNVDKIKISNNIFMREYWYERFEEWPSYLTQEQYNSIEIINQEASANDIGFERPTSALLMLGHLLNSSWKYKYQIYFTCLDVDKRAELIDNNPSWAYHNGAGKFEENYLKNLISNGTITQIKDE